MVGLEAKKKSKKVINHYKKNIYTKFNFFAKQLYLGIFALSETNIFLMISKVLKCKYNKNTSF